ncbi:cytochrome c oxidase subunit II [Aliifodinibius sp. S!AR15-10]|uniref:cytochrome c oxidase subunit II n=1 Tax=Aliifodinibius sp. S!AR15-10 TaxID=2950437 RepID=UPI002858519C|nr:cytochrome c oxidase subunit II [Aliifodinibius sp. S!AR15-10]MDR8393211.1 cytochrome c oxidase subunit II [Aliifodinibius sp. S!AR15-10]
MDLFKDLLLPPAKSTVADNYDQLFEFVHMSSLLLTIAVLAAIIYFIIKYRRKSENEVTPVITHNNALEITWSVVPLVLVLFIFGWGFQVFLDMTSPPDDAYEVQVTAQKWLWRFQYENGASSTGELHVPADRPVRLVMSSNDVIHSFFVPDYRIKQDVVPGRYTSVWFNAPETGESTIFCTEYCGTDHSNMTGSVVVHEEDEFETWLAENAGGGTKPDDLTPAEWGEQLVQENACNTCHSTDGTELTGPTWQGKFGSEEPLSDGSTVTVDENYLRESILQPGAHIVQGYDNVMPPYQGVLSDEQINAIIEYIKTLK